MFVCAASTGFHHVCRAAAHVFGVARGAALAAGAGAAARRAALCVRGKSELCAVAHCCLCPRARLQRCTRVAAARAHTARSVFDYVFLTSAAARCSSLGAHLGAAQGCTEKRAALAKRAAQWQPRQALYYAGYAARVSFVVVGRAAMRHFAGSLLRARGCVCNSLNCFCLVLCRRCVYGWRDL